MTTPYNAQRTISDYSLNFSDEIFSVVLPQNTDVILDIPKTAPRYKAVIKVSSGSPVFVAHNAVSSVPVNTSFAESKCDMVNAYSPLCREVVEGDKIHFFSPATGTIVVVLLYALYTNQ